MIFGELPHDPSLLVGSQCLLKYNILVVPKEMLLYLLLSTLEIKKKSKGKLLHAVTWTGYDRLRYNCGGLRFARICGSRVQSSRI